MEKILKNVLLISLMIFASNAIAVCSSTISRTAFSSGQVLTSTKLNSDFDTAYARLNELPGNCVTAGSITTTQISNGTIVAADIADSTITLAKLAAASIQASSSSSTFSTSSISYVDVTNLSVSFTATGRPVLVSLIPSGTNPSYISTSIGSGTQALGRLKLLRTATTVGEYEFSINGASGAVNTVLPSGAFSFIDTPSAGTYTYKLQALSGSASQTVSVYHAKLVVREL